MLPEAEIVMVPAFPPAAPVPLESGAPAPLVARLPVVTEPVAPEPVALKDRFPPENVSGPVTEIVPPPPDPVPFA